MIGTRPTSSMSTTTSALFDHQRTGQAATGASTRARCSCASPWTPAPFFSTPTSTFLGRAGGRAGLLLAVAWHKASHPARRGAISQPRAGRRRRAPAEAIRIGSPHHDVRTASLTSHGEVGELGPEVMSRPGWCSRGRRTANRTSAARGLTVAAFIAAVPQGIAIRACGLLGVGLRIGWPDQRRTRRSRRSLTSVGTRL